MNTQQSINSVIVGLGKTGLSVARYLASKNDSFAVVDSRDNPPNADDLKNDYSSVPYHFGDFKSDWFATADQLVVNPGIAIATPEIQQAKQSGAEIIGDIELFAREIGQTKPIVAITGSNGKTTVTLLLDLMAKKSGVKVGTGGNVGTPALDLLLEEDTELFVLELSSYQLETSPSLQTISAVVLNVSEDHLDRYDNDLEKYAQSKSAIYNNCKTVIANRDDAYSIRFANEASDYQALVTFGLDKPEAGQYGIALQAGKEWLAKGDDLLMTVDEIKLPGSHNVSNALATLALGDAAGLKVTAMLEVLKEFAGTEHRTQWLAKFNGVNWYNDSKGTNVGATLAALSGLPGKAVLIAGGQGKGADFLPLQNVIKKKAIAVVLMGEDAQQIADIVPDAVTTIFVDSMSEAVKFAHKLSTEAKGSEEVNVLLSPACASFDMFKNYRVRGEVFMAAVSELEQGVTND
ncbi:MAG: UDP-N-acetylmuramoyl-L-alanine--D-glutamate ligase [Cocleimonas sp.]|nr:UDP-N-acetylmuramoyl-L-alanine--D-glutamate ligase [Cocleimonas sp.]